MAQAAHKQQLEEEEGAPVRVRVEAFEVARKLLPHLPRVLAPV